MAFAPVNSGEPRLENGCVLSVAPRSPRHAHASLPRGACCRADPVITPTVGCGVHCRCARRCRGERKHRDKPRPLPTASRGARHRSVHGHRARCWWTSLKHQGGRAPRRRALSWASQGTEQQRVPKCPRRLAHHTHTSVGAVHHSELHRRAQAPRCMRRSVLDVDLAS